MFAYCWQNVDKYLQNAGKMLAKCWRMNRKCWRGTTATAGLGSRLQHSYNKKALPGNQLRENGRLTARLLFAMLRIQVPKKQRFSTFFPCTRREARNVTCSVQNKHTLDFNAQPCVPLGRTNGRVQESFFSRKLCTLL